MAGVDLLFGPMLIGVLLNMMLYGFMLTQMLKYYQRYPNDFVWIRYFMLYLFIAQTVNLFVEVGIIYEPLIIKYGKTSALIMAPKMLPGDSILITMVSTPVQFFTAWRIGVITKSFIVPTLIAILSAASFVSGTVVSIMVTIHPEFQDFALFSAEVIVWLVCSALCDIAIAVAMTHALYTRRTGLRAVDNQIHRIVRMTVETGTVTAITALLDVLLFLAIPNTRVNFVVDFPLSNLYTCSVLVMLNSRERKKTQDAERAPMAPTTSQKPLPKQNQNKMKLYSSHSQSGIEISTSTEKSVVSDARSEHTLVGQPGPITTYHNAVRPEAVSRPRPTHLQLDIRPKTIARSLPESY